MVLSYCSGFLDYWWSQWIRVIEIIGFIRSIWVINVETHCTLKGNRYLARTFKGCSLSANLYRISTVIKLMRLVNLYFIWFVSMWSPEIFRMVCLENKQTGMTFDSGALDWKQCAGMQPASITGRSCLTVRHWCDSLIYSNSKWLGSFSMSAGLPSPQKVPVLKVSAQRPPSSI